MYRFLYFFLYLTLASNLTAKTKVVDLFQLPYEGYNIIMDEKTLRPEIDAVQACILACLGPIKPDQGASHLPTYTTPFPLEESSLKSFNEPQALFSYLLIAKHYIENARKLSGGVEQPKVLIRIVRGASTAQLQRDIEAGLSKIYVGKMHLYYNDKDPMKRGYYLKDMKTFLHYADESTPLETLNKFDIVLTIGGAYTTTPTIKAGDMILPTSFIHTNFTEKTINSNHTQAFKNHLTTSLKSVVGHPEAQRMEVLLYVNSLDGSPNVKKQRFIAYDTRFSDYRWEPALAMPAPLFYTKGDEIFLVQK